ncbi:15455_t:CDS:1, partial [Racocetra persica]
LESLKVKKNPKREKNIKTGKQLENKLKQKENLSKAKFEYYLDILDDMKIVIDEKAGIISD